MSFMKGRWCSHAHERLLLCTMISCSISMGTGSLVLAEEVDDGVPVILEEIVVTATKTPHTLKEVPVDTVVINRKDIERSNAHNIIDVLKTVPGVSTSAHDDTFGTYTWQATMRGLSINDGYALVLVDGERVMGSGQSGGMGEYGIGVNQIPLQMIERIEIVKGPGSALYGSDAMAGVINIITRSTPEKEIAGAGTSYSWYTVNDRIKNGVVSKVEDASRRQTQASAYYGNRPSKRLGYLLQYNRETAQDVGQSIIDSERNAVLFKTDFTLLPTLKVALKGELSEYEKKDNREEDSFRISPRVDWQPMEGHLFTLSGYTYTWDFDHGYIDDTYGHKYGDISYNQINGLYVWSAGSIQTVTAGAEFQSQVIDYIIDNPDGTSVTVDENIDIASIYVQDEIVLIDGDLTVVPGLRYDDHSTFGSETNPKLSMMYYLSDETTLRGSVGRAFKSPTIRQLYYDAPYNHGSFYALSNPDLKPETAMGYSIGLEQLFFANTVLLNTGYFRNDVDDLVVREDSGTTYNDLPLLVYRNVEQATIQGLEVMLRIWPERALSFDVSYTYTDSENKENGKSLTYTPDQQFSITPAYDIEAYGVGVSSTLVYSSKQYTNTDNSSEIDGHTVVDVKIYKKLGSAAKLSLAASNIFDSDKGDISNYRVGQVFTVKLDLFL